jgi:AbrB family looped-hinge helix DNA binding protein
VQNVVRVTRKGQTTIPVKLRQKLGINQGDELMVEVENDQLVFTPIRKLEDCAGIYAKYAHPEDIKKEIDQLREEY